MAVLRRITVRDIAARLDISHVTVSLALRGSPRISKKRCEQIQAMAKKLGYRPDPTLTSLAVYRLGKRPPRIHSALAWINHWEEPTALRKYHEFNAYWEGASLSAERFGYRLDEFVWKSDLTPDRMESILATRNVRGILIPPHPCQPDWGNFSWDHFSFIRFGHSVQEPISHVVASDHLRNVVSALRRMQNYGYERIGFVINGDHNLSLGGSWMGGYMAAKDVLPSIELLPPLITRNTGAGPQYQRAFKSWFTKNKPDALLTGDPRVSAALKQLGVRVPEDVAVAGTTAVDIPGLDAGIEQHSVEIGKVAAEALIALINANDLGPPAFPRRILVEGTWIDGKTMPNRRLAQPVSVAA